MKKKFFKIFILEILKFINKTFIGNYINKIMLDEAMSLSRTIDFKNTKLLFSTPNKLNEYRVATFSSKEPETIEWIDDFIDGSTWWDVGANVGLYSCYAALKKDCKVIAFEPSVFNLELLARNISNNRLIDKISILPLAIAEKQKLSKFNLSTTQWGGALSTFGETYGQDGKDLDIQFKFNTFSISLDMAQEIFKLPKPEYLKIDVDGIEHLILKGSKSTLESVKEVLVEINEDLIEQSELSSKILKNAGFKLKKTGKYFHVDKDNSDTIRNQIWKK